MSTNARISSLIDVSLVEVTPQNIGRFPTAFTDLYSGFEIDKAACSFVATVRISRRIDFYKATKRALGRRYDATWADIERTTACTNRVTPEPPARPLELEDLIVAELCRVAEQRAQGKTYQFYRIIVLFEAILDKSQMCCCGLVGFNWFQLDHMAESVRDMLSRTLKSRGQEGFSVFTEFETDDVIRKHGNLAAARY